MTALSLIPAPLWMARVAINAVVHIPPNTRVMEIGRVVVSMASRALKD